MSFRSRPSLGDALSTPDSKHRYVRRLFSVIADRYDLITVLLSYGQDRRWKRRLVQTADREGLALDLACGTGDIAFAMGEGARRVVGLDITPRMVEIARSKRAAKQSRVSFLVGDMTALPFSDERFSVVTTGYGLRNVPRLDVAVSEICRVLAPGGQFLSLDFNKPASRLMRSVFLAYLTVAGSVLGTILHGDPDTYRYIPESLRRYPTAAEVCEAIRRAGFRSCVYHPLLGGLMTLHEARK